jgi:hypothetical protein
MAKVDRLPRYMGDMCAEHRYSQAEDKVRGNQAIASVKEHHSPHASKRKTDLNGSSADYGYSHHSIYGTDNGSRG